MFKNKEYIDLLLEIKEEQLMPMTQLAEEIGVAYRTLLRLLNKDNPMKLNYVTMKKIKAFIDKYKEQK